MPHISNPEREAARWMTLVEACAQIAAADRISEADALVQLRGALADGVLACRWDAEWAGSVPRGKWWLKADVRIPGDGQILDDDFDPFPRYKALLILRRSLSRKWPVPPAPIAPSAAKNKTTPPLHVDVDAVYKQRIDNGGIPTSADDEAWRKQMDISRRRLREVRKPYVKAKLRRRETARSAANPRRTRAEPTPNRAEPAPNPRRGKS